MTVEEGRDAVSAIRRRDRSAWAAFYDRHVGEVYAFVSHLVQGNRPLAEELHQEIWLAAIDNVEKFDPQRGTLRNWILGIARRQVALHFRRKGLDRSVPLAHDGINIRAGLAGVPILPSDCAEGLERASLVRAAMAALAKPQRDALTAKYLECLSVREMAEKWGKTPKAVESLLSRARAELRQLLQDVIQ